MVARSDLVVGGIYWDGRRELRRLIQGPERLYGRPGMIVYQTMTVNHRTGIRRQAAITAQSFAAWARHRVDAETAARIIAKFEPDLLEPASAAASSTPEPQNIV